MAAVVPVDDVILAPVVGRQPIGRVLRSNHMLLVGLVIFLALAAATLIGSLFVEEAHRRTGAYPRNEAPSFDSLAMILGTTSLGQSVSARKPPATAAAHFSRSEAFRSVPAHSTRSSGPSICGKMPRNPGGPP